MPTCTLALCATLVALTVAGPALAKAPPEPITWKRLQRGVEHAIVPIKATSGYTVRDNRLHVVRVDPREAKLVALTASQLKIKPKTAAQWADQHKLVAAINLGMYQRDHRTHVGYLRAGSHVNSRRWVPSYLSALAFDPRRANAQPLLFADLDPGFDRGVLTTYRVVSQNLRLIKSEGHARPKNVWSRQKKRRWSEAAVAQDQKGRLLMLFTRVPLTMWELNNLLLSLPLGIVRAMHMEGGPEASLSIRGGTTKHDLCGSFESGFLPNDSNLAQWPLPNVLGVLREEPPRARRGTLCLAKIRIGKKFRPHSSRTRTARGRARILRALRGGLRVSVDGGPAAAVSTSHGATIQVPLDGSHLVVITTSEGKRINRVRFRFSSYQSDQLCLWYRERYDNWHLAELRYARRHRHCLSCPAARDVRPVAR